MGCPDRSGFIEKFDVLDLSIALPVLIELTCKTFRCKASHAISDNQIKKTRQYETKQNQDNMFYVKVNSSEVYCNLSNEKRVVILNKRSAEHENNSNFLSSGKNVGTYHYRSGTIFLHEDYWCRSSIMHELFHSLSIFAKNYYSYNGGWDRQRSLREGLTETLVGYFLAKNDNSCYIKWKKQINEGCMLAYGRYVKYWCCLAQIIGIKEISSFYFNDGTINDEWRIFLSSLHKKGYTVKYDLDYDTNWNYTRFGDYLFEAFEDFENIYYSDTWCNFDNIN